MEQWLHNVVSETGLTSGRFVVLSQFNDVSTA